MRRTIGILTLTLWAAATLGLAACGDDSGSGSCGDGVVDSNEDCDGTNLDGRTCDSLGLGSGTLLCSADCSYNVSGCGTGSCGNGAIDSGEDCDGANLNGEDCVGLGFAGGTLGCTTACRFDVTPCEAGPDCGNGQIDGTEQCDGANLNNTDCTDLGYLGGTLSCLPNCGFDESLCADEICGNGTVEGGEVCDGANLSGQDCTTQSFDGGTLACAGDCQSFVTSGCCADSCTSAGDTVCQGDVLRTCTLQTSGCLAYDDFDCTSAGQTCSDSSGTAQCEGACTSNCSSAGDTQCDGATLQTCTTNGSCVNWVDSNCHPGVCTGATAACAANGTGHGCGDWYSLDGLSFPHTISGTFDTGTFTSPASCQSAGANWLFLKYTVTGPIDRLTLTVAGGNSVTWPIISAYTTTNADGLCDPTGRTELGCNHAQSPNGTLELISPSVSVGDVIYFAVSGDWANGTLVDPEVDLEVVDCASSSTTSLLTLPTQLSDVAVDTDITVQFIGELPDMTQGVVQIVEDGVATNYNLATSPPEITFFGNEMTINPASDFATDVDVDVNLNLLSEVCGHTITDSFTFHTVAGPPPDGEDCAGALPINDTGVTNVAGQYTALAADVITQSLVPCNVGGFATSGDAVFTFELIAPMTDVSIMIPKALSAKFAGLLLSTCAPAALESCAVVDEQDLLIINGHNLTAGTFYLVVGDTWYPPAFDSASLTDITITQYRVGATPNNADGVGTVDFGQGGGPQGIGTAGYELPMFVDYGSNEYVQMGDDGYREFHVAGATGIRLIGTYDTNSTLWHRLRVRDPNHVYYFDQMGVGSFDVFVPGDTAIIGTSSTPTSTAGYDYTVDQVLYQ